MLRRRSQYFSSLLEQNYQIKAQTDEGALSLLTPFGVLQAEFAPSVDKDYICWSAVFRDIDEFGKPRDIYAIRLTWNGAWTDSTGLPLHLDEWEREPNTLTVFQVAQRALAAKLRLSEKRLTKLGA